MITPTQLKALEIVRDNGPIRPREFARLMWPSSEAWNHHVRCGPNGSHKGGGMYMAGGGYLGKLRQAEYVRTNYNGTFLRGYEITRKGEQAIDVAHNANQKISTSV